MEENLGNVSVAPEVLMDVVQLTALGTAGVARLCNDRPSGFSRLFNGKTGQGVQIQIEDSAVTIDLYIVAEPDAQMLQLGQTLQREIARAIHEVVGMPVKEINVHIEDVEDRVASATEQSNFRVET